MSSPLPYFISELLCVAAEQLENPTTITLDVITLCPAPVLGGLDPMQMRSLQEQTSLNLELVSGLGVSATEHGENAVLPPAKKMKLSRKAEASPCECETRCQRRFSADLLNAINSAPAWILDVDLDFYSTGNPYRSVYSEVRQRGHTTPGLGKTGKTDQGSTQRGDRK